MGKHGSYLIVHWQHKAKIMKLCSKLPGGQMCRQIQKTFGRLKDTLMDRVPTQIEIARWILVPGRSLVGKRFLSWNRAFITM
jgi:hypothetical protein